ncbi:serine/threonine-protein kinase [Streptomyces sp. NPDC002018]|uniref:serine/threonine-protein kinase n=1 Tax=Streptomyces sp. NPDC002018 TaxID=3364629 RepID=UPI0036C30B76
MGEVWRARDEVLGRPVAVKLLREQVADATAIARFQLEGQTAARLSHPNVVTIYDTGTEADRGYLVMELVEGRSLAEELRANGPTPPARAARIGGQVAAGLAAAHHQGVVHRDVKPANLLLAPDDTVKISDFGIARFADHPTTGLTMNGQVIGTSAYLAPERALGRPAGPAADMYALGCVLYELLTARPPFRADTPAVMVYRHVEAAPEPPSHRTPELPGALDDFVLRLLTKDPARRPTAEQAADFLSAAEDWIPLERTVREVTIASHHPADGLSRSAGQTSELPRDTTHTRSAGRQNSRLRRPQMLVGAAAAALAAVVVGAAATSSDGGREEPSSPPPSSSAPDTRHADGSPAAGPTTGSAAEDAATEAPAAGPSPTAVSRDAVPAGSSASPAAEKKAPQEGKTTVDPAPSPSRTPPPTVNPSPTARPTQPPTTPPTEPPSPTATAPAPDQPDPETTTGPDAQDLQAG